MQLPEGPEVRPLRDQVLVDLQSAPAETAEGILLPTVYAEEMDAGQEWLADEKWRGIVTVTFEVDGKAYVAPPFVLVPHEALG